MFALWLPPGALAVVLATAALFWNSWRLALPPSFHTAAVTIALAALCIRAYAGADLALHPWDERYHALVAKNLIANPLVPTLVANPVLDYDYRSWGSNHVWLHKPPLALWMQAASMRTFGVGEWPMRLPSLIFSTAAVLATYAIGYLLISAPVGLIAAAFHAVHGFSVDLSAGRRATDHVDTLLIFIVEMGVLLALAAASRRPRAAGAVLGVAVGLAYITKSLPALLLLPIWAAVRLQTARAADVVKETMVAAGVAAAVALPWAIYSSRAFPLESAHERQAALRHITEALENQGGPPWTYLWEMPRFSASSCGFHLAPPSCWRSGARGTPAHRALILWVAIPYLLFSIVATKMPAYVMIAAPAIFILQADFWLRLLERRESAQTRARRALLAACLVVLALLPARYLLGPTGPLERRDRNPVWTQQLRALNRQIGARRAVIFNVPWPVEVMFYTPYACVRITPPARRKPRLCAARDTSVFTFEDGIAKPIPAKAE